MRIVGGSARGRVLQGPKGDGIRPTADRVRQALFDILGQDLEGLTVLDLFAGTGALALEAISRGATKAVLVDSSREAIELCRMNAQSLHFEDRVELMSSPAARAIEQLGRRASKFELIFADPPYAATAVASLASTLGALLAPGGMACIEHDRREEAPEQAGTLSRVDQRSFGDTRLSFFRIP